MNYVYPTSLLGLATLTVGGNTVSYTCRRCRWNVCSNDAASSGIGSTLEQVVFYWFSDDRVLASEVLQELRLGPNKGTITIFFGFNDCHVVYCSSWGISEWIEDLVPPEVLGKRVENWTHVRTNIVETTTGISAVEVAVLVEPKLKICLILSAQPAFGSSLDDCGMAWHLAELQLKVVGKGANSVSRLVEPCREVLEFRRGVLLGRGPPTIRYHCRLLRNLRCHLRLFSLDWLVLAEGVFEWVGPVVLALNSLLGFLLQLTAILGIRQLWDGRQIAEIFPVALTCCGCTRNKKKSSDFLHNQIYLLQQRLCKQLFIWQFSNGNLNIRKIYEI